MRIPVVELWDSKGDLTAVRRRLLHSGDIASLLRQGFVRFVIADIGEPLRWIPSSHCCEFWKTEVKPRIAEGDAFDPSGFPGDYCYIASEWADGQSLPLLLLEKYH
jgi:hypothetical protein